MKLFCIPMVAVVMQISAFIKIHELYIKRKKVMLLYGNLTESMHILPFKRKECVDI